MTFPSYLTLEPIDPIDGDPTEIRQFAHDLRQLTDRLDVPRLAAVSLQAVRHSSVWDGDVFLAFLTLIEKLPKPEDIDNAVDQFHWLASELEMFADVLDECQAENRRCRRELDDARPPDVELTDEVLSTMSGIGLQASQAVERLDEASVRLRHVFDDLDQRTVYAEPPPGRLERIGNGLDAFQAWNDRVAKEFVIGIGVGAWEMVKGIGMLAFYLNPAMLPYTAPKLWEHRETITEVATFARQHPRLFAKEMGKAVVDWETLDESPARWLGKMVPDLLLSIATFGSGGAATRASAKTVTALKVVDHLTDASQDLSRGTRALERSRAMLTKGRIALHNGVDSVDKIDPYLASVDVKVLGPEAELGGYAIKSERTAVKDLATVGSYSRMKAADRWVNGVPGMDLKDRAYFMAPRALERGGQFSDLQQLDARFDVVTSTTEPSSPAPRTGPPPSAAAEAGPVPRPDVVDRAPAPPPSRYQTTSSAGPP